MPRTIPQKVDHSKARRKRVRRAKLNEVALQAKLDELAGTINFDNLKDTPTIPVDDQGNVQIDSSHPSYRYWMEDDY